MGIIITYITHMSFLDWGIPGVIILILHLMIKSEILKWAGIGAVVVAILTLIQEHIGGQTQWLTFFVFILWGLIRNRGANV